MTKKKALSTESYKGVRDFYPEEQSVQNFLFDIWRRIASTYGYEEYNASILEPTELYTSKTSNEIVNEQTYTFEDRGGRSVTLRPEMTPTVARMVAGKRRELTFPLRWFSIPNCFRYERPQRGRTREFWQLNVDIFGVNGIEADVEIISIAHDIMTAFGAKESDFEIRVNNRGTLKKALIENRMSEHDAEVELSKMDKGAAIPVAIQDAGERAVREIIDRLAKNGVQNVSFDKTLIRGFQYYTGTVFEVFDTDTKNPRAIFGGGRYDNLTELFGGDPIPAVGFGMGDVVIRDFLETHGLLPMYITAAKTYICPLSPKNVPLADTLAHTLRTAGEYVAVYYGDKKIGDQIQIADKKHATFVIVVGDEEEQSAIYTIKELSTGEEKKAPAEKIPACITEWTNA